MCYHNYLTKKIKKLHMRKCIKRKLCRNSTTSTNCQIAHCLYLLNSYTAISGKNLSKQEKITYAEYSMVSFVEARVKILVMQKDKIVITSKVQHCVLKWYHMYLFPLVLDRTEATILRQLY